MLDLRQCWLLQTLQSMIFCSTTQIRDENCWLIYYCCKVKQLVFKISLQKRRGAFCSTKGVLARMAGYFNFLNSCLSKNHLAGTGWQHSGCGRVEGVAELALRETWLLTRASLKKYPGECITYSALCNFVSMLFKLSGVYICACCVVQRACLRVWVENIDKYVFSDLYFMCANPENNLSRIHSSYALPLLLLIILTKKKI